MDKRGSKHTTNIHLKQKLKCILEYPFLFFSYFVYNFDDFQSKFDRSFVRQYVSCMMGGVEITQNHTYTYTTWNQNADGKQRTYTLGNEKEF